MFQVRFEDDVTDDPVAAEEFVDEEDYFHFIQSFRAQVGDGGQIVVVVVVVVERALFCVSALTEHAPPTIVYGLVGVAVVKSHGTESCEPPWCDHVSW